MGANTFTIESRSWVVQMGDQHYRKKNNPYISHRQAKGIQGTFFISGYRLNLHSCFGYMAVVKYKSERTHPNIDVIGADENYLLTAGYEIEKGRNISYQDVLMNRNVVLLGSSLAKKLI